MTKQTSVLTLLSILLLFFCGTAFSQDVDLSGTWEGKTTIPDSPEPDMVTLELEKKNGGYTGKASDSLGLFQDAECQDLEFKDNALTFSIFIYNGEEFQKVFVILTINGDTMSGHWESESGDSAPVELARIK